MITPKQLQQRFAYMFEGGNIGISIPKGWMPEFAKLCEQIDELLGDDKDGFHWRQCTLVLEDQGRAKAGSAD